MKLGIVTSYYFRNYGMTEGARRMARQGYSCADYQDFINTETDFFRLDEQAFEAELKRQRRAVEEGGIVFSQTHAPWRYPPRDLEPADKEERLQAMMKSIRGTAYLGCSNFVVHPIMPFGANSAENSETVIDINCEFMGKLSEAGKEYGVTVCLENMPFPKLPITTAKHVKDFAKRINSDYFKVCLDTGHALVCKETLAESVRYIGKEYLATLHVHDNDGTADRHLRMYEGIGEWEAFSDALADIGFDGTFSIETSPLRVDDPKEQEKNELTLAEVAAKLAKIK